MYIYFFNKCSPWIWRLRWHHRLFSSQVLLVFFQPVSYFSKMRPLPLPSTLSAGGYNQMNSWQKTEVSKEREEYLPCKTSLLLKLIKLKGKSWISLCCTEVSTEIGFDFGLGWFFLHTDSLMYSRLCSFKSVGSSLSLSMTPNQNYEAFIMTFRA